MADEWNGLGVHWLGADGSVWDLNDTEAGVLVERGGVRGLGMPDMTRYSTSSPGAYGSRYRGFRVNDRDVFWPVFIGSTVNGLDWIAKDRAFWRSLRVDTPGVWQITQPDGVKRSLTCRFVDDGQQAFEIDPAASGAVSYGVTLVADEEPMWCGDDVTLSFGTTSAVPFFSGAGGVVSISPGYTLTTAVVINPGDLPAWPRWRITGPCDSAYLGANGGQVSYLPALAAGQWVEIDTRPTAMTAVDQNGTDVSNAVGWNPLPVPEDATSPLDITITPLSSACSVSVTITPLYYRAW